MSLSLGYEAQQVEVVAKFGSVEMYREKFRVVKYGESSDRGGGGVIT